MEVKDDAEFSSVIKGLGTDTVAVVDFTAKWCGPCKCRTHGALSAVRCGKARGSPRQRRRSQRARTRAGGARDSVRHLRDWRF